MGSTLFEQLIYPGANPTRLVFQLLKKHRAYLFGMAILWILWLIYNFSRLTNIVANSTDSFDAVVSIIVRVILIPCGALFLIYLTLLKNARGDFLKTFALINGFNYKQSSSPKDFQGSIFRIGDNGSVSNVIQGEIINNPFTFCIYSYQISNGRAVNHHNVSVLQLELDTPVPEVVLQPDLVYFGTPLNYNLQKLRLENPLENKYNLWTKPKFEIEALQIFSHTAMETIEKFAEFTLEFKNTSIFIYFPNTINYNSEIQRIFSYSEYFILEVKPKLQAMRSGLMAMKEQFAPKGS